MIVGLGMLILLSAANLCILLIIPNVCESHKMLKRNIVSVFTIILCLLFIQATGSTQSSDSKSEIDIVFLADDGKGNRIYRVQLDGNLQRLSKPDIDVSRFVLETNGTWLAYVGVTDEELNRLEILQLDSGESTTVDLSDSRIIKLSIINDVIWVTLRDNEATTLQGYSIQGELVHELEQTGENITFLLNDTASFVTSISSDGILAFTTIDDASSVSIERTMSRNDIIGWSPLDNHFAIFEDVIIEDTDNEQKIITIYTLPEDEPQQFQLDLPEESQIYSRGWNTTGQYIWFVTSISDARDFKISFLDIVTGEHTRIDFDESVIALHSWTLDGTQAMLLIQPIVGIENPPTDIVMYTPDTQEYEILESAEDILFSSGVWNSDSQIFTFVGQDLENDTFGIFLLDTINDEMSQAIIINDPLLLNVDLYWVGHAETSQLVLVTQVEGETANQLGITNLLFWFDSESATLIPLTDGSIIPDPDSIQSS
jgi:hypothetical protein